MATGTPIKEGGVPTVRKRNVGGPKRNPAKDNVDRLTPGAAEQNEPKSTNEQRGKKDAGVNGDAAAAPASMDESQVNKFNAHRVDTEVSTVEIQVEWEDGETTWEAERDLQEVVPALVYKYWDGLGGRESATNLELYHVFKISKRAKVSKTQYMYRVQWVGYDPTDSTWEHDYTLQNIAPDVLEKFEAKVSKGGTAGSQKRKNIRSPGGPRKKVRGANN
ncbi:hypothetical protein LRP88_12683 [Fusarium phalaenopsidis]